MNRQASSLTRIALVAAFGAITLATPSTLAQEPGSCTLDPITLPMFDATPPAVVASTPQSAAAVADVTNDDARAAVELIVACANETDPALAWAIFTDRYLAEQFIDPTVTNLPAFEQFIDQGETRTPGSLVVDAVGPVTTLEDGRISLEVTVTSGSASYTNTLVLALVDDTWLIDDVLDPAQD